jgi:hypothetical protein
MLNQSVDEFIWDTGSTETANQDRRSVFDSGQGIWNTFANFVDHIFMKFFK